MHVKLPQLKEFKADELLDVKEFQDFVAPNTTTDRPLFLRKHLLNVHDKAVEALTAEQIRLVSLVGCPGTGKTWCGWLVAYTLHKACKKKTLHLTIRNSTVTAIANFKEKKQYAKVSWNENMLEQVLGDSQCQVCIVDVSMNIADEATRIFTGIQQLIEDGKFADVKFMGLMSGHGQEKITGKQLSLEVLQKLVLWSWSEEEVAALCTKLKHAGWEPPSDEAYKVCGGTVRYLLRPKEDERIIREAVRGLSQDEMKKLLALDMTLDDQQGKNRTRLLAFFPRHVSNAEDKSFADGIMSAQPMPRSDFVIKNIKENKHAKFEEVLNMYRELSGMNPGAAGSAFELLVHLFWREAPTRKDTVVLQLKSPKAGTTTEVSVSCGEFKSSPKSIEEHEKMEVGQDLVGYFTPDSPYYRVLDSILRYKCAGETKRLAIQISIAKQHGHDLLKPLPKLLQGAKQLALWDFPPDKRCTWKPEESADWELLHVSCEAFNKRMLACL